MVAANFTMVAVMTMTPVHVQLHGQDFEVVGAVISGHVIGMFALSLLSGHLADWRGGPSVVSLGIGTLVSASLLAAFADPSDVLQLSVGVFLLGLGWNLCWVGGSSMRAREGAAQIEGDVDAVVRTSSAAASLLSGGLLAVGGLWPRRGCRWRGRALAVGATGAGRLESEASRRTTVSPLWNSLICMS